METWQLMNRHDENGNSSHLPDMVYYRNMTTYSFSRLIPVIALFLFLAPFFTFAQAPCGEIIGPEDNTDYDTIISVPVADCSDPFETAGNFTPGPSPYTLTINGEDISNADVITIEGDGISDYEVTGTASLDAYYTFFYLHDGDDYRYVDTRPLDFDPDESDWREYAAIFPDFSDVPDIEPYIAAALILDCTSFVDMDEMFLCEDFLIFGEEEYYYDPLLPPLEKGTYTVVVTEYMMDGSFNTFWDRFFAALVPTVHAQSPTRNRYTLTFTLEEEEEDITPPPTDSGSGTKYGSKKRDDMVKRAKSGSGNDDDLLELIQQLLTSLMEYLAQQSQVKGSLAPEEVTVVLDILEQIADLIPQN